MEGLAPLSAGPVKVRVRAAYLNSVTVIMGLEAKEREQGILSPKSYVLNLCQVNWSFVLPCC